MAFVFVIVIHLEMLTSLIDGVVSQMAEEIVQVLLIRPLEPFISPTLL